MNRNPSDLLELLQRAEAWCDQFHEIATDPSGERLRHLRQRHCVERRSYWKNVAVTDWEKRQNEFCQRILDATNELDRLLPDLRDAPPGAVATLERARGYLRDLRGAILGIMVKGDADAVCREWFERMQGRFRQLKSGEASWVPCPGCSRWYRDAAELEAHFKELTRGFPCGLSFGENDKLDDEETFQRHLGITHHGDSELRRGVYLDTQEHVRSVDEVVRRCRKAYGSVLEELLQERLRAERAAAGDESVLLSTPGVKDIRRWLDQFHAFATDDGGTRKLHIEARRFVPPVDAVYGEVSLEWKGTRDRLDQDGRKLEYQLDRMLAIAPVVAPTILGNLKKAGKRLSDLRRAFLGTETDQDAFELWQSWRDGAKPRATRPPPSLREDEEAALIELCPFCKQSFAKAADLVVHFDWAHPPPPPGSRVWIDPQEHLRNVEQKARACRRIWKETVELLRDEAPQRQEAVPRGPKRAQSAEDVGADVSSRSASPDSPPAGQQIDKRTSQRKAIILDEFERRLRAGKLSSTPTEEAENLLTWFMKAHPDREPPAHNTIYNYIQTSHRAWREQQQA